MSNRRRPRNRLLATRSASALEALRKVEAEQRAVLIDTSREGPEFTDERDPVCHLNYAGDLRVCFADNEPLGWHARTGRPLWPVTVQYDEATERTRVGLTQVPPLEVQLATVLDRP